MIQGYARANPRPFSHADSIHEGAGIVTTYDHMVLKQRALIQA